MSVQSERFGSERAHMHALQQNTNKIAKQDAGMRTLKINEQSRGERERQREAEREGGADKRSSTSTSTTTAVTHRARKAASCSPFVQIALEAAFGPGWQGRSLLGEVKTVGEMVIGRVDGSKGQSVFQKIEGGGRVG